MADESKHVGVHMNAREVRTILEPFDEEFESLLGDDYKRSEQVKIAMMLWRQLAPRIAETGYDVTDGREVGGMARQAILDHLRLERPEADT